MPTPLDYGTAGQTRTTPSLAAWAKATGDAVGNVSTGWTTLALLNSWATYVGGGEFGVPRYRKAPGNVVFVEGLVAGGTVPADIAVLPVGFRPTQQLLLVNYNSGGVGRFDIYANGAIRSLTGGNSWYSICCSFIAGQ